MNEYKKWVEVHPSDLRTTDRIVVKGDPGQEFLAVVTSKLQGCLDIVGLDISIDFSQIPERWRFYRESEPIPTTPGIYASRADLNKGQTNPTLYVRLGVVNDPWETDADGSWKAVLSPQDHLPNDLVRLVPES